MDRGDAESTCRCEKLRAVGNDALPYGSENIQKSSCTARRDLILVRNLLCNGAGHDDGDGVVRRGDINERAQGGNADLRPLGGVDMALDGVEHKINAAICLYQTDDSGHHNRDHGDIIHAHHAALSVRSLGNDGENILRGNGSRGDANHNGEDRADDEDEEDVHAGQRSDKHDQIGDNLQNVIAQVSRDLVFSVCHHEEQNQRNDSGGQNNADVFTEFILHLTSLRARGGDGCVGDHGKVVTEHGAAHNGSHAQCPRDPGLFTDSDGDWRKGHNRSDGGSHGGGNEAADEKETGYGDLRRQNGKSEIDGAVNTAGCLDRAGKRSREDKDETHDHDVFVAHIFCHARKLFREAALRILQESDDKRDQEADNGGHRVKVLKQNAAADKYDQKDGDGQKCPWVPLFHNQTSPSFFFPRPGREEPRQPQSCTVLYLVVYKSRRATSTGSRRATSTGSRRATSTGESCFFIFSIKKRAEKRKDNRFQNQCGQNF